MGKSPGLFCNRSGFFGLIALLLVLAIIAFLSFKVLNTYLNRSAFVDKSAQKVLSESERQSSSSYTKILDNTRKKVDDLNRQAADLEKKVEELSK